MQLEIGAGAKIGRDFCVIYVVWTVEIPGGFQTEEQHVQNLRVHG